ncbi:MAG: hypothetical protein ABIM30_00215 [candidate division WOR-3 bacterium]
MSEKKKKERVFIKASEIVTPPRIPSGIFVLDLHLGRGSNGLNGWSIGRMNTVYGDESGGKTTLVLKAIGNAQKLCSKCYLYHKDCSCKGGPKKWSILFIDAERTWTKEWAEAHGIKLEDVDIYSPESLDDLIDCVSDEISNRDIIVIETLAAILSSEDIDSVDDMIKSVGLKARKLDQAAQKWMSEIVKEGKTVTFFIENQLRKNISVSNMPFISQDETENLPGGKWQKFFSTVIVRVYPSKPIVDIPDIESEDEGVVVSNSKDVVAQKYTFEVKKNKVFIKGGKESFILSTMNDPIRGIKVGDVISNEESVAEAAINLGIATKIGDRKIEYKGGKYSFPYMKSFIKFLRNNPQEYEQITKEIIDIYESRHSVSYVITTSESEKEVSNNE